MNQTADKAAQDGEADIPASRMSSISIGHQPKRRWSDFIWAVYSLFFFIEPIRRNNLHYWLVFAGVYILFAALYAGVVFARARWQSVLMLCAMAVLGVWYLPHNDSTIGLFIYPAAFLPFVVESTAVVMGSLMTLCLALLLEGWLLHLNPWLWGMGVFFSIVVGTTNLIVAQSKRANSKLMLAHEEMTHLAKLAERERIARDMHDVLGHTLSVVVLKSELAGRIIDSDPARAKNEIADVEQAARKALSEVREAIRGYRSEGLAAEIDRAHRTLDAAGVALTCESRPPSLPPAEETVLSLIVREAVTNVVRHAQASQCLMRFSNGNGQLLLTIEDDGRGGVREEGFGLRGMRERVEALGGRFSIEAATGMDIQGTRLHIEIPVRP